MKTINKAVIFLSIFLLFSCGSISIIEPTPITEVVNVKGKDKNLLYIDANNWMVESFVNAKSVIQFSDKENGVITGKYLLSSSGFKGDKIVQDVTDIFAIIKIELRDNKARITISPYSFKRHSNMNNYSEEQMNSDVKRLIRNFKEKINKNESNDW